MDFVSHDGRETAYREVEPGADGPGLLYIHGSGGSHRLWTHQYGPNGPSHPAVALDLSGHGKSDDVSTPAGPETLSAYADDVVAVARETGARVIVGNSMGGAIVQHILIERDLDVATAVLAGTGAKLPVAEPLRELLADDFDKAVEVLHGDDNLFHDAEDQTVKHSVETIRAAGQEITQRDFLTCHEFDVRDSLEEIDVPVLAVTGEYDGLTPPWFHEYLAEHIDGAQMALIEDAAHLTMAEQPVAFRETVQTFLDERL